jgi:lysozyme family protein
MTASNRDAAISKTLTYEGGYTNDPRDPGGATNWGITIADARMYWKADATPADVKAMPKYVAIQIYQRKYWAKMGCDARPSGVDFVEFDFGVNSGVARSLKYRAAMPALAPVAYVKEFCKRRSSFLQGLKTFSVFGKGWSRRVADVEATGVAMALRAAGQPVAPAVKQEAKAATTKAVKNATGATGAAGGTAASAPQLPDISTIDASSKAGMIFIGIVVVGVVAYFVWNAVKNAQRAQAYNAVALEG